jgi:hypothetical protein
MLREKDEEMEIVQCSVMLSNPESTSLEDSLTSKFPVI